MSTHMVRSGDGTRLRAWSNDGDGPPVLLCNGLGAPPEAWPRITSRESGYQVVTWDHRGLGGSERPADPSRVRVEDHTEDAQAVLDAFDLPSVTVLGWSLGVNVAFELAINDPARVRGVLAVAGLPGGTYFSMFGTFGVPRRMRPEVARVGSRLLPVAGPLLPLLLASLPPVQDLWWPPAVRGPAQEATHPGALRAVLHAFAGHDWTWYRHLGLALADHAPLEVAAVRSRVSFVAGRYDALVDVRDMRRAARQVPGARLRELAATHFVPLQYPGVMREELDRIVRHDG